MGCRAAHKPGRRKHSGTFENCQIGVFLAYASGQGQAAGPGPRCGRKTRGAEYWLVTKLPREVSALAEAIIGRRARPPEALGRTPSAGLHEVCRPLHKLIPPVAGATRDISPTWRMAIRLATRIPPVGLGRLFLLADRPRGQVDGLPAFCRGRWVTGDGAQWRLARIRTGTVWKTIRPLEPTKASGHKCINIAASPESGLLDLRQHGGPAPLRGTGAPPKRVARHPGPGPEPRRVHDQDSRAASGQPVAIHPDRVGQHDITQADIIAWLCWRARMLSG